LKFFYIVGKEHKKVGFNDKDGNVIFSLNITHPDDVEIDASNIYAAPNAKMTSIVNSINHQFGDTIGVKLFTDEVARKNNFIKTRIIGKHKVYGEEETVSFTLAETISFWKEREKSFVDVAVLGGFSGNLTQSMTSSSVLHAAINEMASNELQFNVNLFIDDQKNESIMIGPYLLPVGNVFNFPISLYDLNKFDAVFITEEDSITALKVKEANNLHDFFAEVYGVKSVFYKNTFLLDELEMETMGETIDSFKLDQESKSIMISSSGFDKDVFDVIIKSIKREFPNSTIFSFEPIETDTGINIISLNSLINNELGSMGVCLSQMDLVVGEELFMTYLSATFEVPTLILSKEENVGIKYFYYKSADVLTNSENLGVDNLVNKNFLRISSSIKKFWGDIEKKAKEDARLTIEEPEVNNESGHNKSSLNKIVILSLVAISAALFLYLKL